MGALTDMGANALLDGITTGAVWGSQVWAALSSTDPAVSVTEPVGGGYARVPVALDGTVFAPAVGRQAVNGAPIDFPEATAAWGVLPYVAFYTDVSDGALLLHDVLPTPAVPAVGDTPAISPGGLVLSA